ncbi:hypothetical protein CU097_000100, partial [Rhizopus azygosporus]
CIDGRLTSAWNWCSQIEKKPYFPIFLLAGFTGFDGGGCYARDILRSLNLSELVMRPGNLQ